MLKLSKLEANKGQIEGLPKNPRIIKDDKFRKLVKSIEDNPEMTSLREILVYPYGDKYVVIAGNMRLKAMKELGYKEAPCKIIPEETTVEQLKAYTIKDNSGFGEWDFDMLNEEWDLNLLEDCAIDLPDAPVIEGSSKVQAAKSLSERFGIIPFSILDTRKGEWQKRKRAWIDSGLKSEAGRSVNLTFSKNAQPPHVYNVKNKLREQFGREPSWDEVLEYCDKNGIKTQSGTSIFDPVLCEMMYRWFNVPNGVVVDPFAGGSVRGIVASKLGMTYNGCDLRREQIECNIENAKEMLEADEPFPNWICGDSSYMDEHFKDIQADMIMTCPPYADLEVYSDDPRDLSTMEYNDFINAYRRIIKKCADMLKPNRFAVFVVSEVRDKKGNYYNFVGDTIRAGLDAGLKYYNEMILINQLSSVVMSVSNNINTGRKVGRCHQNVIIFYKTGGGVKCKIKDEFPPIDISKEDIDRLIQQESDAEI